jgi:ATP-dependent DNA helicase Rep
VRDKWQRRLRYLLVDEYQDTNTCQYELVKLDRHRQKTDVYRRGRRRSDLRVARCDHRKSENAAVDFPDLEIIKLEQNYRSSTRILQAANAVIGNNPKLFEKSLWSEHGLGDPVKVLSMQDDEQEANKSRS